jgi:predicted ATP-dependent serine protease
MVKQIKVKLVRISLSNFKKIKMMKQDFLDFIILKTFKVEKMKIILESISVIFTNRCTQLCSSVG